jgi:hypothetical protein
MSHGMSDDLSAAIAMGLVKKSSMPAAKLR